MVFEPKISLQELAELDRKVGDFYRLIDRYFFSSLPDLCGRQVYRERLAELLGEADCIKPESEFDELVLRNARSNLTLTDIAIDYLTDPDSTQSMRELFNRIGGEGAWDYLTTLVQSTPREQIDEYFEIKRERDSVEVDPFTQEAQESAKEWLLTIGESVVECGISEGHLPSDFDMGIALSPPGENSGLSCWNAEERVLFLRSTGFDFFHEDDEVVAVPLRAHLDAFHEVLGHAAHQVHSDNMPFSLRLTEEVGAIAPTKPITEGVASAMEKHGYDFLRQRIGLSESVVQATKHEMELEEYLQLFIHMSFALFKQRELTEGDFDGFQHILKGTQDLAFARRFTFYSDGLSGLLRTVAALGPMHYERTLNRVRQEFGEEYPVRNERTLREALFAGVWSWEVYPDAVVYFLRNEDSFVG